jgi:F-box and WD-40 domain protein 1/11
MSIIAHLPTSEVAEIVRRLRPRLYIDFFKTLPTEVCLKILGFLDPVSLINTARASRQWMLLALDRKLWQQLYMLEGFRVIQSEVRIFEESLNIDRSRPSGESGDEHASKRRATPQRIQAALQGDMDSDMIDVDLAGIKQMSIFGGKITKEPVSARFDVDIPMMSPPHVSSMKSTQYPSRIANSFQSRSGRGSTGSNASYPPAPLLSVCSLMCIDPSDNRKKLNWQYLYSQRRRLEANWEAERYSNFQLPHPAHPDEAHEECIYTIQHSGKYLVSGSRDKTLRIWDLDTCRLVRAPLRAHSGSVLCLQFDADPEEDLIVSGSSDATVVLWKFSTGQVIQRLRKAHRESVLNVRFDKRVLVTCSKDKTIKIFNRKPLSAGELGYPDTSGVNPVPTYLNNYGYNPSPSAGLPVKPPYSMIGCLEGHGAAVNAVQIHENEVVSASGDRTVKVWDWPEQTCIRTLIGHSKGIACVQYDGRRIVSGSSDNEVKVFDKESGLEVASLRAHTNLVRTVQAGFGDLPFSAEEDREDAKAIDHEYFRAVDSGAISRDTYHQRGRPRNAGSRKPEDITAYGAKLPPGGGGGKFGRIVSGSYDETIIIWRRDKEGVWRAQHTLRQEEAAHAASRMVHEPRRSNDSITSQVSSQPPTSSQAPHPPASAPQPSTSQSNQGTLPDLDAPTVPFAPGSDAWYRYTIATAVTQGAAALRQTLHRYPLIMNHDYLDQIISTVPAATQQLMRTIVGAARQTHGLLAPGPVNAQIAPSSSTGQMATPPASQTAGTQTVAQVAVPGPPAAPAPQHAHAAVHHATPAPHHPPHHHHHLQTNMARVFKLQFDARRIICCSQTSIIVGWDFANGDEQIIEASRFFAPIE